MSSQEAVVFIPGLSVREEGFYLELLGAGLIEQIESNRVQLTGDVTIEGNQGKQFKVLTDLDRTKIVDVYELYWGHLVFKLSDRNLKERMLSGTRLLFYWFFSRTWMCFRESPALFFSAIVGAIFFIAWYYGTLALVFAAIGEDPDFLGIALNSQWAEYLGNIGSAMGGWSIWLVINGFIEFFPLNVAIDIMYFAMKYIEEDSSSRVLRAKIRNRIFSVIDSINKTGTYDKITIVGHSFGVMVAVDFLGEYRGSQSVQFIALGGPLKILSYKESWIEREIQKCLENDRVDTWHDFYSDRDWLCTKTPIPNGSPKTNKIQYHRNPLPYSIIKQLSGKSHLHYFTDSSVLRTILGLD